MRFLRERSYIRNISSKNDTSISNKKTVRVKSLQKALTRTVFFLLYKICGNLTDKELCAVCEDETRDRSVICVVEDVKAVMSIEKVREYRGLYHVLHGVISPVNGITPDKLKIKELLARIDDNVKEIIVATNPTVEGEATAMYLSRLIKPLGVKVTRLAYGVPVGADLEYADEVTLFRALEGRRDF